MRRAIRRTLPNPIVLHIFPDLNDDPSTFVARALHPQVTHLGKFPIIHHEVHIGQTEPGDMQFDEHVTRAYDRPSTRVAKDRKELYHTNLRHRNFLYLDVEVRALILLCQH